MGTKFKHLQDDIDTENPMDEKPFFKWLESCGNPPQTFIKAIKGYMRHRGFKIADYMGKFALNHLETYRYTFNHFWYRLRYKIRLHTSKRDKWGNVYHAFSFQGQHYLTDTVDNIERELFILFGEDINEPRKYEIVRQQWSIREFNKLFKNCPYQSTIKELLK